MKILSAVGLLLSLIVGTSLALIYKELVALTGSIGFVLAAFGGVMALISLVIMMIALCKAIKHRVMIR